MSRELRFDAITEDGSHFLVPSQSFSLVLHDTGHLIQMWCSDGIVDEFPVKHLRQFTGLQDKNDKDIYEGDIVRAWIDYGPGGEIQSTYEVTIGDFGPNLQAWTFKENDGFMKPEIIGNIVENKDLI